MKKLGKFSLDEVLPYTGYNAPKREYIGKMVRMNSLRYQVFKKKGVRCVSCGVIGDHFILEYHRGDNNPHFNLYTKNGILMTKDHVIPKCMGGMNRLGNLQPMCVTCNTRKGDKLCVN